MTPIAWLFLIGGLVAFAVGEWIRRKAKAERRK